MIREFVRCLESYKFFTCFTEILEAEACPIATRFCETSAHIFYRMQILCVFMAVCFDQETSIAGNMGLILIKFLDLPLIGMLLAIG